MSRLMGALCLVVVVSLPHAAAAQVLPLADCVTQGSDASHLEAWFGYRNPGPDAVAVPLGPDNFFVPPPTDRGQPIVFDPGEFHRVFSVEFPVGSFVSWVLASVQAPADASLPTCNLPMTWLGAWDAAVNYDINHIVSYAGSSWIARRKNAGQTPGTSAVWDLVAQKGEQGIQGERGAEGPQGVQGPAGPEGAPGITQAFPASAIYVIPEDERLTILDPNVQGDSVVIATYVGGSREDPPEVSRIRDGQITIRGRRGMRVRYVVFK